MVKTCLALPGLLNGLVRRDDRQICGEEYDRHRRSVHELWRDISEAERDCVFLGLAKTTEPKVAFLPNLLFLLRPAVRGDGNALSRLTTEKRASEKLSRKASTILANLATLVAESPELVAHARQIEHSISGREQADSSIAIMISKCFHDAMRCCALYSIHSASSPI